jgi:flagellar biosynthesis chaperone FliJ
MKRLERLLALRKRREEAAAGEVAGHRTELEEAEERMKELVATRSRPVQDARRLSAFQMTGHWTAEELQAAEREMLRVSGDLDSARAALKQARTERRVLQEHVDRARASAAVIAARVAQSSADELAILRRMREAKKAPEEEL